MSTTQQPEALRDARWYMVNKMGMATLCTSKKDAEKEARAMDMAWPHMGPHRAVQLVDAADVEAMRAGYAAARLEIESLQARIKAMAEEHADELTVVHLDGRMRAAQPAGAQPAGEQVGWFQTHPTESPQGELVPLRECLKPADSRDGWQQEPVFRADRAMRAALAAGAQQPGDCGNTPYDEGPFTLAQQPGVAYAALPDADRDYMRKVVAVAVTMLFDGYKEDVTRVFSTGELSEFVTITAAMGGERVEDIYRRAWDLLSLPVRASHGQAPAGESLRTDALCDLSYSHGLKAGWNYCASDDLAGFERAQKIGAEALRTLKSPTAQAAPAAVAGPKKWAPEEVEDGERGIRWVTNEGIHGRPTDHDVREYLNRTPTAKGCLCDECTVFYASSPTAQPAPQQEPVAWFHSDFGAIELSRIRRVGWKPLYAAPQPLPASQGNELDTARLDWLDKNIFYRDMPEWDAKYGHGSGYNMWVLFAPKGAQGSARSIIDAARAAQEGKSHD